jgi:uncharacterized repeat protein (TIGR02543 family)
MKQRIIISILIWLAWCFVSCENPLVIEILPKTYTVTFDKNGGDTEAKPNTKIVKPSTTTIDKLPEEPTRAGYVLMGWNKKADGSGSAFTANTTVTDNITVYAQWRLLSTSLSGSATINGTYKIGEELSVDTSNISGAVAPFMYQWKSSGIDITGETNAVYTIRGTDAGKIISCVITHNVTPGSITVTGQIVPYTIKFDITGLTNNDSVSFAEHDFIVETYGNADDTITIYYMLTGGNITDRLILTFNNTAQKTITTPGSANIPYAVAVADVVNGIITIAADFLHTNLYILDAPQNINLTKNGVISFAAGANNTTAGCTYTYTFYKDNIAVGAYTGQSIAGSGTTVSGLVAEMLAGTGAYTVKVTSHTTNAAYIANSIQSVASNAIYVYTLTVTITGANGMEKVTLNTIDHTANFIEYVFGGDTVILTAGTDRNVVWSGDGTATGKTFTIVDIDEDVAVNVIFSSELAQTITKSTYNTTAPLVGETIYSTDGTYTPNDGGNAGTHAYQWKRSDNNDRTGNVAHLSTTKDYAPAGTDFGKYIWLETTPVGSNNLTGAAVPGDVLHVGVKLIVIVTGASGGTITINFDSVSSVIVYESRAYISLTKNNTTDTVVWSASEDAGSFNNQYTIYTISVPPSVGTITLTATLSVIAGTVDNPFLVATIQDLQHVGKPQTGTEYANWTLTAHYKQVADINMTGQPFTAIGNNNDNQRFTGSYDGQGHTIINLTINGGTNSYQGLFGYIQVCEIKNVGLVGGSVTGDRYVGGLIGANNFGTVTNCYTTGNVTGTYSVVGGLIGLNSGTTTIGTVTNCYTTGNVTGGTTEVGGLIGSNSGTVTNCYATGDVTGGTYYCGGVVGDNTGTVQNCYATGDISGRQYVGGVAGRNSSSGKIQNNIALNARIKTGQDTDATIGRIVGGTSGSGLTNNYAWERMTVKFSFTGNANKILNKSPTTIDGADLLIINAKTQDAWTTAGFVFNTANWKWTDGKMPHLFDDDLWNCVHVTDLGTESNPFLVATVEDLQNVGILEAGTENVYRTLTAHYKQTANIDLTGTGNWTPIGDSTNNNIRFTGTFDGQGYTIIGLTTNSNNNYQGLFSFIGTGGTVKNVGLVGGSITGGGFTGGIAGVNQGTIQNCYNTGSVSGGTYGWIGGVVGENWGGLIKNCYTTGNISGNSSLIGGVAGDNDSNGTIENCVALNGSIVATGVVYDRIGRVVGIDSINSAGPLINNYARDGMTITSSGSSVYTTSDAAGKHGADAVASDYEGPNSGTWWRDTVLFPDSAWNFAANALPTLKH